MKPQGIVTLAVVPISAADVDNPLFNLPVDVSRGMVPTMADALCGAA